MLQSCVGIVTKEDLFTKHRKGKSQKQLTLDLIVCILGMPAYPLTHLNLELIVSNSLSLGKELTLDWIVSWQVPLCEFFTCFGAGLLSRNNEIGVICFLFEKQWNQELFVFYSFYIFQHMLISTRFDLNPTSWMANPINWPECKPFTMVLVGSRYAAANSLVYCAQNAGRFTSVPLKVIITCHFVQTSFGRTKALGQAVP